MYSPIFVVGAGRSGTTLVASLIAAHPDVAMLPESSVLRRHLLPSWHSPMADRTDGMAKDPKLDRLGDLSSVLRSADARYKTGEELMAAIFDRAIAFESRVVEKDPRLVEHVVELCAYFPRGRVVNVERHAPDVVASRIEADWSRGQGVVRNSIKTLIGQEAARAAALHLDTSKVCSVSYDELVVNPDLVIDRLLGDLELRPCPDLLKMRLSDADRWVSEEDISWKTMVLRPLADRRGRSKDLTPGTRLIVNVLTASPLTKLIRGAIRLAVRGRLSVVERRIL